MHFIASDSPLQISDHRLYIYLLMWWTINSESCKLNQTASHATDPQTRTVPNSCFSSLSLKHQRKSGESDLKIMPYCSVLPHLFETWVWKLLPHCEDTWCRALSVYHQLSSSWSTFCSCRYWVQSVSIFINTLNSSSHIYVDLYCALLKCSIYMACLGLM